MHLQFQLHSEERNRIISRVVSQVDVVHQPPINPYRTPPRMVDQRLGALGAVANPAGAGNGGGDNFNDNSPVPKKDQSQESKTFDYDYDYPSNNQKKKRSRNLKKLITEN